ncbi:MAG: hypothetical protein ACYTAO_15895 [Planctomycetota bacterium]|jgi:hypothetical protein
MDKNKDLLASVSDVSTESEFFSPVPKGYKKKGKARYVFVMGTVGDERAGQGDILFVFSQADAG